MSEKVDLKDIPESVKMYVDEASVGPVVAIEEKILKTDLLSTKNQMEILNQSIMQTEASLTILDKLKEQQEEVVSLNEQVEARTLALRKRELNTESELSRVKMATSSEKSRLLELISEIGDSVRTVSLSLPDKREIYFSIEGLIHHFEQIMTNRGFSPPIGEAYGANETANGELGFYLASDGGNAPYRARCRPPSFINYQCFPKLVVGHTISDVVAVLGSLNIIAAELDR